MADWFYKLAILGARWPLFVSARPTILGRDHARLAGGYILASTHFSHYDSIILMTATPRMLDFLSIVEAFRNPLSRWFLSWMNAFPLDRSRSDPKTVRIIFTRLQRGRVIAMYPEAGLRDESNSVATGGAMRPGIGRIARRAGVPIVPAVVLGGEAYSRWTTYLPIRRVRYGVIYGPPICADDDAETKLADAFRALYKELHETLPASR